MKNAKKLAALLLAVVMVFSLTGCKEKAASMARQLLGTATDDQEEEDSTNWATEQGEEIILPAHVEPTAKFAASRGEEGNTLYLVFNGIWSRDTGYFKVPEGSLTITANGSAEGLQSYKISVWKQRDHATEYVAGSTGYIHTDGKNYTYTVSGLDPEASYRLTVSYDSSRYYLYGMAKVVGIG